MKLLKRYIKGFVWLYLGAVSYIPSHYIRNALLAIAGMKMSGAVLYSGFQIRRPSNISIGRGSVIGHGVTLDGRNGIKIGENVNFSSEVMIWTMQHDYNDPGFCASGGSVVVEDYAWVSARAIILPNVVIGEGAVVAAGAVVVKDVPPFAVVGGVPARIVAWRNKELDYIPAKQGSLPFV